MQNSFPRVLKIAWSLGVFVSACAAQNAPPNKVIIPLLIQDSHHRAAAGVTRDVLVVFHNKIPITDYFLILPTKTTLRLGIVIDASNSQRDFDLDSFLVASKEFASTVLQGVDGRVFFAEFDTAAHATRWLTVDQIANVSSQVRPGGGTALYDALVVASQKMACLESNDSNGPTRCALVVISDGEDNASQLNRVLASAAIAGSGTIIFSVRPQNAFTGANSRGERVMEDFAKATGGEYFTVANRKDLSKVFQKISDLLEGLYFVTFSPPAGAANPRELEVKYIGKAKLHISTPQTAIRVP